jgi:hypothetical protein
MRINIAIITIIVIFIIGCADREWGYGIDSCEVPKFYKMCMESDFSPGTGTFGQPNSKTRECLDTARMLAYRHRSDIKSECR